MTEAHITIEDMPSNVQGKVLKRVIISGQLDESNVDEKAKEIYALIDANPAGLFVVFDFEGLEYMNSKSIGYLTDWYGKIFEAGGKVYIVKARENILDILQVVGLTQLIQSFGSLEELQPVLVADLQGGAPQQ